MRFYSSISSNYEAMIAFRGGVSGNAEGDDSGFFMHDTNTYTYLLAQSDINLPNAVLSGQATTGTGNEGSLWVTRGGSARFRKLASPTWIQTQNDGSTDTNTIGFDELAVVGGSTASVRRFNFLGTTNHVYLPLTTPIQNVPNSTFSTGSSVEFGGSFTWSGSLNDFLDGATDRRFFIDGQVDVGHYDHFNRDHNRLIWTISQETTSLLNCRTDLGSHGQIRLEGGRALELRPY